MKQKNTQPRREEPRDPIPEPIGRITFVPRPSRLPIVAVFLIHTVATAIFVDIGQYAWATATAMWAFGYLAIFEGRRSA